MDEKYFVVKENLKKHNQEQLLDNYEKLDNKEKTELLNEILTIDFKQIERLYKNNIEEKSNKQIEPISYIEKEKISDKKKNEYNSIGKKIIENGQYAVVTMAGGQRNQIRT